MTQYNITCATCGQEFTSKRDKYKACSTCRYESMKERGAAKGPCKLTECEEPQFCKGFCNRHYWADKHAQAPREYPDIDKVCDFCGNAFKTKVKATKHCSSTCGVRATVDIREATKIAKRMVTCTDVVAYNRTQAQWVVDTQATIDQIHKQKVRAANIKRARDKRSPMRRAYEDGDMNGLIQAIKAESHVTEQGCWEWGRRRDRGGYGKVQWAGKNHAVHRLAALAKYGQPESEPVVHHVCANRTCCNPDHLQPVSQRENMAEMLERNYYLRRIAELEAALEAVDPHNAALSPLALSA